MNMFSELCCVLFCYMCGIHFTNARKYDLEAEAQKLYGEDLTAVLRQFRKTPEYADILKDKLEDLKRELAWISFNVKQYYQNIIEQKIKDVLRYNDTQSVIPDSKERFRGRIHRNRGKLRQSNTTEERNLTNVEILDGYTYLYWKLNLQERNMFKDLGFEFAGKIIHELIKAMSGDDSLPSTVQPGDNKELTTHDHSVTHEPVTNEGHPEGHDSSTVPPNARHHKHN